MRRTPGPTGVAHIRVGGAGENDIVIAPMANAELGQDDVRRALDRLRARVAVLVLQLEIRPEVTVFAARAGRDAGLRVVLDPAPAREVSEDIWRWVDLVTPNETEASVITGIDVVDRASARAAAEWFAARGVRDVVLTLGKQGAVVLTDGRFAAFAAMAVRAVDTTAAGDAVTGTLAAAVAARDDLDLAVRRGMAAGALTVTRVGASDSLPSREEILRAVEDLPPASSS